MRWEEFAAACPEIASMAEERFARDQLVLLGTIRADGSPRISPCEVDLAAGRLFLGMMWRSKKALDLLRDPRIVVHSVTSDREGTDGDVKLYGRPVDEARPEVREAFCRAIEARIGWRPTEPYHLFSTSTRRATLCSARARMPSRGTPSEDCAVYRCIETDGAGCGSIAPYA